MRISSSLFLFVALMGSAADVAARPLLENSQQTYAGACLASEQDAERMVEICETALAEQGATDAQRQEMQLELAYSLYLIDSNDRAQELVDEILSKDPDNGRALGISGWIDWDQNQFKEAKEHFEKAVETAPTAKNLSGLASAVRHSDPSDHERFLQLIDTALAIKPDDVWAQREKGWGLVDVSNFVDAEEPFRKAYELGPHNQWSIYGLAYVLNELNRYDEALVYLNQAVDENTDVITEIYSQRSLAQFYEGRYKIAVQDADRVIEAWPNNANGYVRRARALEALGQRDFAMKELQEFLENGHDDFAAYWLADLHYNEDDFEPALKVLSAVFEEGNPGYHDYEFQALLLLETERFDEANEVIDAALELRPDADFPLYYRALIQVERDQFDEAEATMRQALENGLPNHREAIFLEALVSKAQLGRVIKWKSGGE